MTIHSTPTEQAPKTTAVEAIKGLSHGAKPALEIEIVSMRDLHRTDPEKAAALAEQSYRLFKRSFPDPDERISKTSFINRYCFGYESRPNADHLIAVDKKTGRAIGGSLVNVFDTEYGKFGIETYLYVARSKQGRGVGTSLLSRASEHAQSKGACLLFGEMNDPFVMTPAQLGTDALSGTTAADRRQFWKNRGRLAVDAPYAQPNLDPENPASKAVEHLLIMVQPFDPQRTTMTGAEYKAMIHAFFSTFVDPLETDPTWLKIKNSVKDEDVLKIIPLDQKRSCVTEEGAGAAWGRAI